MNRSTTGQTCEQTGFALFQPPDGLLTLDAAFDQIVNRDGKGASAFFAETGIADFAARHGGICAVRLGGTIAVYQCNNQPIIADHQLEPSLAPNAAMFGQFMGVLPVDDARRKIKRMQIEALVGSSALVDRSERHVRDAVQGVLVEQAGLPTSVTTFAIASTAAAVDRIAGLLDFSTLSLRRLLMTSPYAETARGFFESASQVIAAGNDVDDTHLGRIRKLIHDVLTANLPGLAAAPSSNLVKSYFAAEGWTLDQEAVAALEGDACAELATLIMATYDTTALTLVWLLGYAAIDPEVMTALRSTARASQRPDERIKELEFFVLEAIRLGGSNPTALWRTVSHDVQVEIDERMYLIPAGTKLWLDRFKANRDSSIFSKPEHFAVSNVKALLRKGAASAASAVSRGRHEINSFAMVNTHRNERKCPGRAYTLRLLAIILDQLLRGWEVELVPGDLTLKRFSAMPQPSDAGTITVTPSSSNRDHGSKVA